jgi:Fe2+ transport system protein FeoA
MKLTQLHENDLARVVAVEGGPGFRQQLCLRGLCEGTKLRMLSCTHGPVLVDIKGYTLALGRGMAHRIVVEKVQS